MCIGLPMQIKSSGFGYALCEGMGIKREVNTLLIGDQPPGTWVLVFLDSAREVLTQEQAEQISKAVSALDLAMQQAANPDIALAENRDQQINALFADLIDREVPKPDSLLQLEANKSAYGDKK